MKRLIRFGKIKQFRDVVRTISHKARFDGLDENQNPIYNSDPLPTIMAIGTEKIHGTNAAVCYSHPDGMWTQARKKILTIESDNAGCAFFVESRKDIFKSIINELAGIHSIDLNRNIISIFFEFAGGSIQPKSACTGMEKRAIIFAHFKVSPLEPQGYDEEGIETDEYAEWLDTHHVCSTHYSIFNISRFVKWAIQIDFNAPSLSVNSMIKLVADNVEPNSPAGQAMGVDGNVGEGIVFSFHYRGERYIWKVKGEKHSGSKIKKLQPVDEEKENKIIDFVNLIACKPWRLEQAYQEVFNTLNGGKGDIKKTGDFLRWVINDVIAEESDILNDLGLEPKGVKAKISHVARTWFMNKLQYDL